MKHATFAAVLATVVLCALKTEDIVRVRPDPKGRVVVTYWEKWSNFEADAMRAVVDRFNSKQDKIFVKFLSISGIADKTMLATSGGIPPDVAGLFGPNIAQYAFFNAVTPLDEFVEEAGISGSDYVPVWWEMCNYRGHVWALPSMPATTALHYNTAMLEAAGLDPTRPPTTIQELDAMDGAIAKKDGKGIQKMGFLPMEPGWWNWAWGYYFGGSLYDGEGRLTLDSPENVRAFTWMAGYAKKYGTTNVQTFKQGFGGFDSPQNAFFDQKLASVLQGVWMANFIGKHRPNMEWKAVPFPYDSARPDRRDTTMADLDVLVIPRGAKHPKAAFEFIKFVQSQEGMELLALGQKKDSALSRTTPGFYEQHPNPNIELFRSLADSPNAVPPPKIPIWSRLNAELGAAIDKMNTGKVTPEEALRDVQRRMQPVLDETLAVERLRERGGRDR